MLSGWWDAEEVLESGADLPLFKCSEREEEKKTKFCSLIKNQWWRIPDSNSLLQTKRNTNAAMDLFSYVTSYCSEDHMVSFRLDLCTTLLFHMSCLLPVHICEAIWSDLKRKIFFTSISSYGLNGKWFCIYIALCTVQFYIHPFTHTHIHTVYL